MAELTRLGPTRLGHSSRYCVNGISWTGVGPKLINRNMPSPFDLHSIHSELVYRFNWGGAPIATKY
jgi:hypothetical protein